MKKLIVFVLMAYCTPIFSMHNNSCTDQDLDFVGALQPIIRKAFEHDAWERKLQLRQWVNAQDQKETNLYTQATENGYQEIASMRI